MRRAVAGVLLVLPVLVQGQTQPKDVILRSMIDEMERSRKLALPGLETPYYIEYTLEDAKSFSTSASLGATLGSNENRFRVPRVKVRVGDYKFDNTNYIFSNFSSGSRYDPEQASLDDKYEVLRRGWWLATDRAYKSAVEALARKRAALKNITQPESLPDFWRASAVQKYTSTSPLNFNSTAWTEKVRNLSATFRAYPEIISSNVSFNDTRSMYNFVNSEGTVVQRPEPLVHLTAHAAAFAQDGTTIHEALSLPAIDASALPSDADLAKQVTDLADHIRALVNAPSGENYSGPVLFEGVAGPQVIAELLAPNFVPGRRPVGEPGRQVPFQPSELENRIDSRVLPEFLTVVDDPSRKEWNGKPLLGSYDVDDEGVAPKPLTLIEKGRLKAYLLTRQPVRGQEGSNGRARLPGGFGAWTASISNLFVQSSESMKNDALRQRFLKLLQDRNKPYGMIVRKMDFPSSAAPDELRRLMQAAQQSGAVRPVSAPILVYKVYPDGKEQLVRGLRFRGLTLRSLRDIMAVSEEVYPLHYLNNGLPFALMGGGGYVAPVSVIGPSLLFEELELERPQDDTPKLPVVPAPPIGPQSASRR